MEVSLSPERQSQLEQLSQQSGRSVAELVDEALADYLGQLQQLRTTLEERWCAAESSATVWLTPEESREKLRLMKERLQQQP